MRTITVNATSKHENGTRPTIVNLDTIAYITAAGEQHDADGPAAIVFVGGLSSQNERLVCAQSVTQVQTLIAAANA